MQGYLPRHEMCWIFERRGQDPALPEHETFLNRGNLLTQLMRCTAQHPGQIKDVLNQKIIRKNILLHLTQQIKRDTAFER